MRFDINEFAAFELFILKRPGAENTYSEAQKMVNAQIKGSIAYPFNERSRLGFNAFVRNDRLGVMAGDSIELQTKIQNNTVLDKIVNYRFPKFIEDLNNDKYRIEKINELKLLTYNKSDSKALRIN